MVVHKGLVNTDSQLLRWMQIGLYGALILYLSRIVLIPLSFGVLISFVLYPIAKWFERRGAGKLSGIILSLMMLLLLGGLVVLLLVTQMISFLNEWPGLQQKVFEAMSRLSEYLVNVVGLSAERLDSWMKTVSDSGATNLLTIVQSTISFTAYSIVMLVLIPVYVILILYYRQHWINLLHRLFPSESLTQIKEILTLTIQTYYNFIKGMLIVYLAVGLLNSVGLLVIGVPHAILFGFIASILTFIPYIGIMVGSLLPIAVAWITYDSIWYPIGVVGVFTFVQYLEANVIFPFAVSNRLNVNTLVMLIAIFSGGLIWGVSGMILFVPFIGIAKLLADHHPGWKTLAIMLGTDSTKYQERRKTNLKVVHAHDQA
jgi:predicted PurR-regulated permease PerM